MIKNASRAADCILMPALHAAARHRVQLHFHGGFVIAAQAPSQLTGDGEPIGQTSRMLVAASEETANDKPLKDRRDEGQLIYIFDDRIMSDHFKNGDQGTNKRDPSRGPEPDGQPK
jgi:hypothetical protein